MTNRSADIGASGVTSIMGGERYRPYPAYKDSGTEWLGEIPAHWEVKKVTRFFLVGSGTTPSTDNHQYYGGGIPWVTTSELRETIVTSTEKTITEKALRTYSALKVYPKGSVAVAMYGATIGRIGVLGVSAAVNQACCVFSEPSGMDAWFWFYWIQFRRSYLISLGYGGGQPNLSQELLKSIQVPTPSLPEQRAIAAFLDRETAKIDALVAKKERLIELLQEKRTALISDAVTKGLDPDVPLKDSGVEWLGEIPAHWDSKRLKTISRIRYGLGQPPRESSKGLPLIRATNVTRGRITEEDMVYVDPDDVPIGRDAFLAEGEIIVVRSGAYTADSAIIPKAYDGAVTGYDMVVTVNNALAEFVAVALLCTYVRDAQLVISSMRSAQPHLNAEELGAAVILLPPLPEQRAISTFLDHETAQIDALVAKVRAVIDRLKELRTALISAAVTGKIDVREAAD